MSDGRERLQHDDDARVGRGGSIDELLDQAAVINHGDRITATALAEAMT